MPIDLGQCHPFVWIHFDHAAQQTLTIGRHKVWYVKNATFDFLQQLPQIVVVKWQGADQQRIQNDATRPHIGASAIVFLSLRNADDLKLFHFFVVHN